MFVHARGAKPIALPDMVQVPPSNLILGRIRDITTDRLCRLEFTRVAELRAAIDACVFYQNDNPKPLMRIKSDRDILQKWLFVPTRD